MASLYALYKKEIENVETIEEDYGFANYSIEYTENKVIVYVQEIYICHSSRGLKRSAEFVNKCIKKALSDKHKVTHVMTTVAVNGNNIEPSLKAILNYGFKLDSATSTLLYFSKELLNG
jgi:hypothetical protein